MTTRTRTATSLLLGAVLLAACSGGSAPDAQRPGDARAATAAGVQVAGASVVTAPLDADERCYVEDADEELGVALIPGAVGCTGPGQPDNPLAAVGSTFTAETMTVTYRGGGYLREPSDNPANPLRIQTLAVFDVTLPGAEAAWFTSTGLREVSVFGRAVSTEGAETRIGECGMWPAASSRLIGAGQGYAAQIEDGQTVTIAYCGAMSASEQTLSGDPYVSFQAALGEGQTYANFALRDQDSDDRAFADVVATIRQLAEDNGVDPDELGLSELTSRFSALTDGAAIVTVDRDVPAADAGAAPGVDSEFDEDGNPPPLFSDDDLANDDGDEDDIAAGPPAAHEPDTADDGPADTGVSAATGLPRGEPVDAPSPEDAAEALLAEYIEGPENRFMRGCHTTGPCVSWVDDPYPEHYVLAMRFHTLGPGQPTSTLDAYVLLERHERRYYLIDRWDIHGPRARPDWVAPDLAG